LLLDPKVGQITTFRSKPYIATSSGYLFDMKGHLHDGGTTVRLYHNDTLKCDSKAIYGGTTSNIEVGGQQWDTIESYEKCLLPIKIERGDEIVIEAVYDLVNHKL
jgi:hypothetical protein